MEGRRDQQKSSRRQQSFSMSKASNIRRPSNSETTSSRWQNTISQLQFVNCEYSARYIMQEGCRSCQAMMLWSARRRSPHWRHQVARILSGVLFIRKVTRRSAWCVEALWMEVVREAMGVIRACRRELREDLRLETRGGPTAEWVVVRGRHSSDLCVGEMVGSLAESRRRGER